MNKKLHRDVSTVTDRGRGQSLYSSTASKELYADPSGVFELDLEDDYHDAREADLDELLTDKEKGAKDLKREAEQQVADETRAAAQDHPVKAKQEDGKPTILEAEEEQEEEKEGLEHSAESGAATTEGQESPEESEAATETAPVAEEKNTENKGVTPAQPTQSAAQPATPLSLPPLEEDKGAEKVVARSEAAPSIGEFSEVITNGLDAGGEQAAVQSELAGFNSQVDRAKGSVSSAMNVQISNVEIERSAKIEQVSSETQAKKEQLSALIQTSKANLETSYATAVADLQTQLQGDLQRLEEAKLTKIADVQAALQEKTTSFNEFVEEQKQQPYLYAAQEADRADSELEQAAIECLSVGGSVAANYPGSGDDNPEARQASRAVAAESAADIRAKKSVIRQDLLERAEDFDGGFDAYKTDVLNQIQQVEADLLPAIEDAALKFAQGLEKAAQASEETLSQKKQQDLQGLDSIESEGIQQLDSSRQQTTEAINSTADGTITELQTAGERIQESIDQLAENTNASVEGSDAPYLRGVRELIQGSTDNLISLEQDGVAQLRQIGQGGIQNLIQTFTSFQSTTSQHVTQAQESVSGLEQRSQEQIDGIKTTYAERVEEGLAGFESSLEEVVDEVFASLDEAIEERKGSITQSNEEFLAELVEQVNESIAEAKLPLTDPLFSRSRSAAEKAKASWWEGLFDAIGDMIVGLIIIVAIAVILVAAGVFSTIMGALLVIGLVLLAVSLIMSVVGRMGQGLGFFESLWVGAQDAIGVTGIREAWTGRDVVTGEEINEYERGHRGTTGVLTLLMTIGGARAKMPKLPRVRLPSRFNVKLQLPPGFSRIAGGVSRLFGFINQGGKNIAGFIGRIMGPVERGAQAIGGFMRGKVWGPLGQGIKAIFGRGRNSTSGPRPSAGLETRGYRPKPGERSMTREQYRQQQSNARANRRMKEMDEATGGHTHGRHSSTKSDKWLRDRAEGNIPNAPIGNAKAATKFTNPNTHARTVELLRQRLVDIVVSLSSGGTKPANTNIPNSLNPGTSRLIITREPMGYTTGRGFFSRNNPPAGRNPLDPTGPLEHASAVFKFMGYDSAGRPILIEVTAYPDLAPGM